MRHARIIGAAGVLIAICSLGATLYLWLRSGAVVRVKAFIRPESGTVHIEATNSGRLTATIKRLELREHIVLKRRVVGSDPAGDTNLGSQARSIGRHSVQALGLIAPGLGAVFRAAREREADAERSAL